MRMVDIICKKRDGQKLSKEEITFFVNGYVKGEIPDYQVSSLCMAIVFKGMDKEEICYLTDLMEHSGETVDLSTISGKKVDKHSTGGVGDKTSMVLGPLVACLGAKLAKMSGRGLGHTGGTLDKLESIPGMSVSLTREKMLKQVNDIGMAIVGQTGDLVPADKKLYALRDVTGTVESIPLIASSIMSKKLASGTDCILLDVKFGSGAFMKDIESATKLANTMVEIGNGLKRDTRAILTDMTEPLGLAVGNALEIKEAINTLHGHGPKDFVELTTTAAGIMLEQASIVSSAEEGKQLALRALNDESAFNKFVEFVEAQGGDVNYIKDPSLFPLASFIEEIKSTKDGYISEINCLEIGESAMRLGAGRETMDDIIDMSSGIVLHKKVGDFVKKGETLCEIHTNVCEREHIKKDILEAFKIQKEEVKKNPIVYSYIH